MKSDFFKPFSPTLTVSAKEYFERLDFPLRIVQAASTEDRPQHEMHKHEFTEMTIVTGGTAIHVTSEGRYTLKAGDLFLIERGMKHGYDDQDHFQIINVLFNEQRLPLPLWDFGPSAFANRIFKPHGSAQIILTLSPEALARVKALADEIETEYKKRNRCFRFRLVGLFIELLVELERNYENPEETNNDSYYAIPDVLEYLELNFMKKLEINNLPRQFGMSRRNFFRNFRQCTNESPYHYLMRLRLENACSLLIKTNYSLDDIAIRSGLQNSHVLCYHFNRHFEMSPRKYRETEQARQNIHLP